jgi:hypothetical protein
MASGLRARDRVRDSAPLDRLRFVWPVGFDPSAGAGVAAPVGTVGMLVDGSAAFAKSGPGNGQWVAFPPTGDGGDGGPYKAQDLAWTDLASLYQRSPAATWLSRLMLGEPMGWNIPCQFIALANNQTLVFHLVNAENVGEGNTPEQLAALPIDVVGFEFQLTDGFTANYAELNYHVVDFRTATDDASMATLLQRALQAVGPDKYWADSWDDITWNGQAAPRTVVGDERLNYPENQPSGTAIGVSVFPAPTVFGRDLASQPLTYAAGYLRDARNVARSYSERQELRLASDSMVIESPLLGLSGDYAGGWEVVFYVDALGNSWGVPIHLTVNGSLNDLLMAGVVAVGPAPMLNQIPMQSSNVLGELAHFEAGDRGRVRVTCDAPEASMGVRLLHVEWSTYKGGSVPTIQSAVADYSFAGAAEINAVGILTGGPTPADCGFAAGSFVRMTRYPNPRPLGVA